MTKKCGKCKSVKNKSAFYNNKARKDGLSAQCKTCTKINNKNYDWQRKFPKKACEKSHKWRVNNPEKVKIIRSQHQKNNPGKVNALTMKHHASKVSQTPVWANLQKIKQIYINCPQGMQVDHIIPLQGKTVSGFHVEYNLQYLSPEDNMKKGNRWPQL
jgi:hypothetical protein